MDPTRDAPPFSSLIMPLEPKKKLFLDCLVYGEKSPRSNPGTDEAWIGAATSCGITFHIALRTVPPPGFSTLHVTTEDASPDTPSSDDDADDDDDVVKRRISVEVIASCHGAILMHTAIETGTFPCFRHDYYILREDAMLRLPRLPRARGIYFGITSSGGDYTVAVLKEDNTTLVNYSSTPVYYGICTYSSSTNKWIDMPVSLPEDLTRWNWDIDTVLANGTTFWWVDLHRGILSYDCVANQQEQSAIILGFIPLPPCIQPDRDEPEYLLRQDRCVGVSAGVLRCVHIFVDCVKAWSWRGGKEWVEDYDMKFTDLWESKGYSQSGLPKSVLEYPTMDSFHLNLVNFFLPNGKRFDGCVIGVDLASMEIVYRGEMRKGLLNMVTGLEIVELSSCKRSSITYSDETEYY